MAIGLECYASEKHDRHTVARLIFESDPVFNTLVYGKDAVGVIEGMLQLGNNYFESSYTRCATHDGRIEPRSIRNRARTSQGRWAFFGSSLGCRSSFAWTR
jgi:hypothetical protein